MSSGRYDLPFNRRKLVSSWCAPGRCDFPGSCWEGRTNQFWLWLFSTQNMIIDIKKAGPIEGRCIDWRTKPGIRSLGPSDPPDFVISASLPFLFKAWVKILSGALQLEYWDNYQIKGKHITCRNIVVAFISLQWMNSWHHEHLNDGFKKPNIHHWVLKL